MKYIAHLKQSGGGCDYTIGCGLAVIGLLANDMDEAVLELVSLMKDEYNGDRSLDSAVIYEVSDTHEINTTGVYTQIEEEKKKAKRKLEQEEQDEKDLLEYQRLQKKFKT